KFTYGETEYGIGIVPLGGYVKMLGQDDDPRRIREEAERARVGAEKDADSLDEDDDERAVPTESGIQTNEEAQFDPRSLQAKKV
ncbi:MAG: hypothetical protein AAF745_16135, partial [Planctomycetota bacterium]